MKAIQSIGNSTMSVSSLETPLPERFTGREVAEQASQIKRESRANSSSNENAEATVENIHKIESAIKTLEIYKPNQGNTRFQYQVDMDTGKIQVKLVNFLTGEVVNQIPSRRLLDFSAQLQKLSGLILDDRA